MKTMESMISKGCSAIKIKYEGEEGYDAQRGNCPSLTGRLFWIRFVQIIQYSHMAFNDALNFLISEGRIVTTTTSRTESLCAKRRWP